MRLDMLYEQEIGYVQGIVYGFESIPSNPTVNGK